MKLDSIQKLFADELNDVLSAEEQIAQALPKMANAANDKKLQQAFRNHLKETREQKKRVEKICKSLDIESTGEPCKGMQGILAEGKELMEKKIQDKKVMDAALIVAAQKVEHYEMASYGALRDYAKQLGHRDAARLLQQTLKEEKAADKILTQCSKEANQRAQKGAQKTTAARPRKAAGTRKQPATTARTRARA